MNPSPSREPFSSPEIIDSSSSKRRRRPTGTPDPDAEVVSLSPKTLLESDRFICEICNQGFQRDQNLQMHRRRHKFPWKLLKREAPLAARKRVYVCPEPSCLHHDPGHALGDLVGIKKHFRRKHSTHKQWLCDKCCKGYAVQSDYKAHLKTCGTRGHSCDCGRVFSRVESFIEHQDVCSMRRLRSEHNAPPPPPPPCLSQTASSPTPSNAADYSPNLELQLLTSSSEIGEKTETGNISSTSEKEEQLRIAVAEKAHAEEVRRQARRQIDEAEEEFAKAKRIRQQAQAELEKAQVLKEEATRRINCSILEITCHSCKHRFQAASYDQNSSSSLSYVSAALREWGVRRFDLN